MADKKDKIDEFIQKTLAMKKQDKMDLSSDEDLSIAIMNLVSMEEHFFFTGAKTGDNKYYELLMQVREMRKNLLKRIIKDYEGEVWCISKHLLAASMRVMEYGTKLQSMGKKEEAAEIFSNSYDLYSLFWGLNLNLIDVKDVKKIPEEALNKHDKIKDTAPKASDSNLQPKKTGLFGKLGDLVRKAIDCCIE
jgi:hypothetical protein